MSRAIRVACTMAALTAGAIAAAGQQLNRAPPREIENVAAFARLVRRPPLLLSKRQRRKSRLESIRD